MPKHPPALTPEMIIAWLQQRERNATRLAAIDYGADQAGWLEDAAYFRAAARAIQKGRTCLTATKSRCI